MSEMLKDFGAGLLAPWRGLAFIARRPRAFALAVVPSLVASLLFVGLGWLFLHLSLSWVASLLPAPGLGGAFLRALLDIVLAGVSLAIALFLSLTLASPLSATALEGLVRVRDKEAGAPGYPETAWGTSAGRALGAGLIGLAVGTPVSLAVLVVDFAFPPAAVVMVPLGLVVSAYVVAWNLLDYPLGLRAMSLPERARWMRDHFWRVTGFGASASLFLFVPGIGLLLLPAGVVGAAIVVGSARRPLPP
jgi:CysZ protein